MLYRVVLTCWEFQKPTPYADTLSGVNMSAFRCREDAVSAIEKAVEEELHTLNLLDTDYPRSKEAVYDSDGKVVCYDYPFRADFDGNHTAIVRFWDGDDYNKVTAYNIYEITADSGSNMLGYRGYQIHMNPENKLYAVKNAGGLLAQENTLDAILDTVDALLLQEEYTQRKQQKLSKKSYVLVVNKNDDITPLRHIITIHHPYEPEEFKNWYYGIYQKLDGDEFIHCATRGERDALLVSLQDKKD